MKAEAPRLNARFSIHVPLILVAGSLLMVAIVPLWEDARMADSFSHIERVTDPARAAVSELQMALALEAAGTRGYLLTGEPAYARAHMRARDDRRGAYARLSALVEAFPPALQPEVTGLGRELEKSDELLDGLYSGRISREAYLDGFAGQHTRYENAMATTRRLAQAINSDGATRRSTIAQVQRRGSWLSWIGVMLSLAAVVSVARLTARYRALAEQERAARAESEAAREEAIARGHDIERISASRDRLARGFTHDVKNPLGAADGYLFMLEKGMAGPLAPKQAEWVTTARRSVAAALALIKDLLALAQAEAGRIHVRHEDVNLHEIAFDLVETFRAQAEASGLRIVTELEAVPVISCDATRILQILGNLVSNAIKYSEAGTITLHVGPRVDPSGAVCAAIDVRDSGPGIPVRDQSSIFDEFHRLAEVPAVQGAGIGLAISRRVAEALGGRLSVESTPGVGSCFTLWLPLTAGRPASPAEIPSIPRSTPMAC